MPNLVRFFLAMFAAILPTALLAVALDLSPHGPAPLFVGLAFWAACYWLFGHASWFMARGNPARTPNKPE